MTTWEVHKYVRAGGRCPLDDWLAGNGVTSGDEARLDAKVQTIERTAGTLPPEVLKHYKGTRLYELKVRAQGKQLRPLCWILEEKKIIILCGAFERDGKIPKRVLDSADDLLKDFLEGRGYAQRYF